MAKTHQTPAFVLSSLMEEYHLNPFSLSKEIGLSNSSIRQILIGKTGVSVSTALRLAKFFGQSPAFWLDLQLQADMQAAANDKELQAALKGIVKAAKPNPAAASKDKIPAKGKAPAKGKTPAKPLKKSTLADKRKQAAKTPGARTAKGKATLKPKKT